MRRPEKWRNRGLYLSVRAGYLNYRAKINYRNAHRVRALERRRRERTPVGHSWESSDLPARYIARSHEILDPIPKRSVLPLFSHRTRLNLSDGPGNGPTFGSWTRNMRVSHAVRCECSVTFFARPTSHGETRRKRRWLRDIFF